MLNDDFQKNLEAAIDADDLEALEALRAEFVDAETAALPFEPAVRLRGGTVAGEFEGDVALGLANGLSRAIRNARFHRKLKNGYSGPIVVSEGDSWFQYPILLKDVIDNLSAPYAIRSLGAAGDTLANMQAEGEYLKEIVDNRADVFLFSASGNDVLGGGDLVKLLNPFEPGMEVADIIRSDVVGEMLAKIEKAFDQIIRNALNANRRLSILFHGYDRVVPRRGGRWLGRPLAELGVPPSLHGEVVGFLIDRLNERLTVFETRFPDNVRHVDCRGRVGPTQQSWYDELHPRNPGYARVAVLFEAQIEDMRQTVRPIPAMAADTDNDANIFADSDVLVYAPVPAKEEWLVTQADRSAYDDCNELVTKESQQDSRDRINARLRMISDQDEAAFERILGRSNLFPVNYLGRGARQARAVAKISLIRRGGIPFGSGTGFLVAPGLLLTNNHVLPNRETARRSLAIFDFADDNDFELMRTKKFAISDHVFFTSDKSKLDFTFVSVAPVSAAGDDLAEFGQFVLIEESGKALKGEFVSIIQHPYGQPKQIALRESKVIGRKGDFIYYTTDTDRGASGSPVLNDDWLPVALHHRAVPDPNTPGRYVANRGVRVSQIIRRVRDAAELNDADATKVLEMLGGSLAESGPGEVDPRVTRPRKKDTAFVNAVIGAPVLGGVGGGHSDEIFTESRWNGVNGYDPDFLDVTLPLPLPGDHTTIRMVEGKPELRYLHFSVVMHRARRLAMVTACNVNGRSLKPLRRRGSWRLDPRLPADAQVGNDAYRHNEYDRGHMVRRLAPMWGTAEDAAFAQADTFHYTNSAPQHARLNQRAWVNLEDYLLDWAGQNRARMSVFTGPILRPDDPPYRGIVHIPSDYWKIAIAEDAAGLRAVGYLHTQKNLIPSVEEAFGDYKTHRVPVHVLAELTDLNFDAILPHDVSGEPFESTAAIRVVTGREDIGFF